MNIKKMKMQMMATAASVVISGIALTSATYAWYAQNTVVHANNMQINASAEGIGFEITNVKNNGEPDFSAGQTTATVNITEKATLIPIHPQNLNNYVNDPKAVAEWHHAFSNVYNDAKVDADTTKFVLQDIDLSNGYGYCKNENKQAFALATEFFLRLNPGSTGATMSLKDIKATNIKITAAETNNMGKCLYLLVAGPDGAYEVSTTEVVANEPKLNINTESGSLVSSLDANSDPAKIMVYAFFDGQDADCKSSNFDPSEISVSLDFAGTQSTSNSAQNTQSATNNVNSIDTKVNNSAQQQPTQNSNATTLGFFGRFFRGL